MSPDRPLDERDVDRDPIAQFSLWFDEAVAAGVPEPEAMCIASTIDGAPSARMVLLKSVDAGGFVFFTNYRSQKALELAANPAAALVWRWYALQRQVRVAGRVERIGDDESDAYFASRARGSQLSAWASPQSEVLADRATLDARMEAVEARFDGVAGVPRPPWWGGLRVVPSSVEFWQGRANRLHDRLRYVAVGGGAGVLGWRIERLAP
jgi:pyridoxamine 5'-phosphate oxidase